MQESSKPTMPIKPDEQFSPSMYGEIPLPSADTISKLFGTATGTISFGPSTKKYGQIEIGPFKCLREFTGTSMITIDELNKLDIGKLHECVDEITTQSEFTDYGHLVFCQS